MYTPLKNSDGRQNTGISPFSFAFPLESRAALLPHPGFQEAVASGSAVVCTLECLLQRLGKKEQIVSKLELPCATPLQKKALHLGKLEGWWKKGKKFIHLKSMGS